MRAHVPDFALHVWNAGHFAACGSVHGSDSQWPLAAHCIVGPHDAGVQRGSQLRPMHT